MLVSQNSHRVPHHARATEPTGGNRGTTPGVNPTTWVPGWFVEKSDSLAPLSCAMSQQLRWAIVGAGPVGLTLALSLAESMHSRGLDPQVRVGWVGLVGVGWVGWVDGLGGVGGLGGLDGCRCYCMHITCMFSSCSHTSFGILHARLLLPVHHGLGKTTDLNFDSGCHPRPLRWHVSTCTCRGWNSQRPPCGRVTW